MIVERDSTLMNVCIFVKIEESNEFIFPYNQQCQRKNDLAHLVLGFHDIAIYQFELIKGHIGYNLSSNKNKVLRVTHEFRSYIMLTSKYFSMRHTFIAQGIMTYARNSTLN